MTPGTEERGVLYTDAGSSSARIPVGLSSWEKLRKGGFVGQNTSQLWQLIFIASLLSPLFKTPSPSPSTPAGGMLSDAPLASTPFYPKSRPACFFCWGHSVVVSLTAGTYCILQAGAMFS